MWRYIEAALLVILIGLWYSLKRKGDLRSKTLALSAVLSFAISILVFPYYDSKNDLPIAIIQAFRAGLSGISMGVNGDIPYSLEMSRNEFLVYRFFLYLLYIIGPMVTSLFLFSFSSTVRTLLSFFGKKTFHVFSALNDKTLKIASSILDDRKDNVVIFCSTKDVSDSLVNKAKSMRTLTANFPIERIHLYRNKEYEFYLLEKDDHETIVKSAAFCEALTKNKKYQSENVIVRVFASDSQRELILNLDRQFADKVYLRHIDIDQSLAIDAMTKCIDDLAIKKDLSVAVVADSDIAIPFVKNLICLMIKPDGRNRISMISPNADKLYARLKKEAPEADEYEIDVCSLAYGSECKAFDGTSNPDLVFVLYEDDELSYETAMRLKRDLSARSEDLSCPKIMCRIEDSDLHKIIKDKDISLFADLKEILTYSKLVNPTLEKAASRVHLTYLSMYDDLEGQDLEKALEESGFYQYQNQEPSFAEALALCFKKKYILSFKDDDSLSDDEFIEKWLSDQDNLQKMGDAEHDRWNAYQRLHGWCHADERQIKAIIEKYKGKRANDPELKLHPAIVSNEELFDREYLINSLLKDYGSDYRVHYCDADKAIIEKLTYILNKTGF